MKRLRVIWILVFVLVSIGAKADSWMDPTWKKMLDSSTLVALVEYTTSGEFQAEAKIISVYKGNSKPGDVIWISGFSNRYGPIDKMEKGDRYIIFLNLIDQNPERTSAFEKRLSENPDLEGFFDACQNQRVFSTPTATSGDLKVKGKNVQYDLTSTTFLKSQKFYSLRQFEAFLGAYYLKKNVSKVTDDLRLNLISDAHPDHVAQYLMQLYLLGYDKDEDVYDEFADFAPENTKYALAQLLGNVRTYQSRNTLFKLLKDESSLVQGEAVRQLKKEPSDIVAPLFVEHLQTGSWKNYGSSDLMNPIANRIDGGKTEIVRALGEMKCTAAIPSLLRLLNTGDPDQFILVVNALKQLQSCEYITYLHSNLLQKNEKLATTISRIIVSENLRECLPSLKYFISNCDRDKSHALPYLIDDMARFEDRETQQFLIFDYRRFVSQLRTLDSEREFSWNAAYIRAFTRLKNKDARNLVYTSIFDWTGFSPDFTRRPQLFEAKKLAENALVEKFANLPEFGNYKISNAIAFLKNPDAVQKAENPVFDYLIEVVIPSEQDAGAIAQKVASRLRLEPKNVFVRYDSGIYWQQVQQRFDESKNPIELFTYYAEEVPNPEDAAFLQALIDHAKTNPYQKYRFGQAIEKIRASLP